MSENYVRWRARKRKDDRPIDVGDAQREFSRRRFLKYAGVSAAAIPAYAGMMDVLSENASAATLKQNAHIAAFASHPKYHFVMVNHVTTNSFFTATIYGIQDACALTGTSYQWTGSTNSIISQMVSAFNSAIAAKATGIGCLPDRQHGVQLAGRYRTEPRHPRSSRTTPTSSAGVKNNRLAYVGQNNLTAGAAIGQEILKLGIGKGDLVAGIIATPGTGNIQPRLDGAKPVLKKAGVNFVEVGTSATEGAPEYNKIQAWYAGHKDVKFMMAVDSGDSNAVAEFIQKNKLKGKVKASVWDVGLPVCQAINAGYVTTTVDQQAYLQGFDTIMQLFLWNVSGGLMRRRTPTRAWASSPSPTSLRTWPRTGTRAPPPAPRHSSRRARSA